MPEMLDNDFDDREKTEGAGEHSGEGHQAKRKNGDVDEHADPKPDELAEVVAATPLVPLEVPHRNGADVLGDLENQTVDIRIRRARFRDLVDNEATQAAETAQVKFWRLVDHEIGDPIGQPTAGVAPPGVLFADVDAEDHVAFLRFGDGEQLQRFGRRVL